MTSLTRSAIWLVAAALAAGTVAAPAAAEAPSDPVPGLVGGLPGGSAGAPPGGPTGAAQGAHRTRGDYGHTHAGDGVLRRGCHNYPYRYVITTPTHDWTLETFLDDRTGETIASGTYFSDSDPDRGREVFRFCRYGTYAGRFKIRAKVHWYNGSVDHKVWLRPSYFRLRRR